ncbi:MAG: hypothetical protein MK089_07295 [Phycisphaerales bacterium]|nr:hypothetical protein [Phycisphaerales bacterium]
MSAPRSGRNWILAGAGLMILAVVIFAIGVYRSVSSFDMKPVLMPGEVEIMMQEPGTLDVAYEPMSIIDGVQLASPVEPPMNLYVVSLEDGRRMELSAPKVAATYSLGGRRGRVIGSAELSVGSWKLIGESTGEGQQQAVYAYGQSGLVAVFMPVLVAAFIAVILGPTGIGCLVVGIVIRSRGRKALSPPVEG